MKFDAFVSYSHAADGQLAASLQSVMSRLGKRWYQRRGLRIFRDKTTLSATPHLWPAITKALDHSTFFILMASPDAAASHWVQQEVDYWLNRPSPPGHLGPAERFLIVLTDGEIIWSDREKDFDWQRTTALPAGLSQVLRSEPLYVDLTWAKSAQDLKERDARLLEEGARLVGAIRGLPPDEIIGEDIRQHRNMKRSAAGTAAVLMLLMAAAGFLWWRSSDLVWKDKQKTTAERVLPQRAGQLDRIRHKPIRDIEISLDLRPLMSDKSVILELRLDLDRLFTQPMSFFFAPFREGNTWPKGFDFVEVPYSQFSPGQPRIDAKFKWFDRIVELNQTIDGTDLGDLPAQFTLAFDGMEFTPGGPGIHLPQRFEIPPLQKLVDDKDGFRLIVHDPDSKTAREVDLEATGIDLTVTAFFREEGNGYCVLFRSRHAPDEQAILDGDYLRNKHSIEREALLHLYPPIGEKRRKLREEKTQEAWRLFESGEIASDDERRVLARLTYQQASLAVIRGQHVDALNGFLKVVSLLEPLIFEREPRYTDAEMLYQASEQPVSYFLLTKNYPRASDYVRNPLLVTERLSDVDPAEPSYRRWRAQALLHMALVSAGLKDGTSAAAHLVASIDQWRGLDHELKNPASSRDLYDALARGLEYASRWGVGSALPVEQWRSELAQRDQPNVPN